MSVESEVQSWLRDVVIGLGLCPFASRPYEEERIRFVVSAVNAKEALLSELQAECELLEASPQVETTVLVLPEYLAAFEDYNDFLDWVDMLIHKRGWEGVFQVASFHPDYCFADVEPGSDENLTNRAPYPLLHILREASVEAALEHYPDADAIPARNIAKVSSLSEGQKRALFPHLFRA